MTEAFGRLDGLLYRRYGRRGDVASVGYPVTLREAGYATTGGWWHLQDASGGVFQARQAVVRLDLMLADVLLHPCDPPDDAWAARYGYRSMSAASRAFRDRHRVGLGDARRVGQVGRWLALQTREARMSSGITRHAEAEQRLAAFREAAKTTVAARGRAALTQLGTYTCSDAGDRRPRYPPVGVSERRRLEGSG